MSTNRRTSKKVSLNDEIDDEKPFVGIVNDELLKSFRSNLETDELYIPFFQFLRDNKLEYKVVVSYFKFNDHQ